jgi:hypothetical protein
MARLAFLGISKDECCALNVLRRMKIDIAKLQEEIEADPTPVLLDDALRIANEEKERFAHLYLGTEHLLLAMIRSVPRVENFLRREGFDLAAARLEVMRELDPNFRPE